MNETRTHPDKLTPALAAKVIGHSRNYVMALIRAGKLVASNEGLRKLPRYRIALADLARWQQSCIVGQGGSPLSAAPKLPQRPTGLLARMREKERVRALRRKLVQA